uniref:Uncharacterized protein n=1 Tax=Suricata suricatta TaxID=37032 RepID=A0A673SY19_SURSU
MEGCVSNLMVCNLAYSGKLEELKERILADKSLVIRTDRDMNAVNQNGCTPLHYAASKNRYEIAVMLLEGGANPDAKDHYEATAMHQAAAKGNLKMIHILLYYKASTNIQDTEGNTPLYLACDEEKVEEAKLPVSQGASIYIENKEEKTPLQVANGGLGLILKRMVESQAAEIHSSCVRLVLVPSAWEANDSCPKHHLRMTEVFSCLQRVL